MADGRQNVVEALREVWFWAGVLRDHAEFLYDALSPREHQAIRWAHQFRGAFAGLHDEAEQIAGQLGVPGPAGSYALAGAPSEPPLAGLGRKEVSGYEQQVRSVAGRLLEWLGSLRAYKQDLLGLKLACRIGLGLGPTLLQHMINEAEEAHRQLSGAREAQPLPVALEALHHHLLWLPDAASHAAALHNGVDGVEQALWNRTRRFHDTFAGMQVKAWELYTMLRLQPRMVGALRRLNRDAMAEIRTFRAFLAELREHLEGCEVMGTLVPLLPDHMLREELYYTEKILQLPEEERPGAGQG